MPQLSFKVILYCGRPINQYNKDDILVQLFAFYTSLLTNKEKLFISQANIFCYKNNNYDWL